MKSKEELMSRINGLSFRTIAFMKNIINLTKIYFEKGSIDKEQYGEALFSFKILKENVIKAESKIIILIEDYRIEYDEMKRLLNILMYSREIFRTSKKCIRFLKQVKTEKNVNDADAIKNLINLYDIFISECDVMKMDFSSGNDKKINISPYKEKISKIIIKQDYTEIRDNLAYINDYFAEILGKFNKNETLEEEINN